MAFANNDSVRVNVKHRPFVTAMGMFVSPDAGETWYEENDGIYFLPTFGTDCEAISFLSDATPIISCRGWFYVRIRQDESVFLPLVNK